MENDNTVIEHSWFVMATPIVERKAKEKLVECAYLKLREKREVGKTADKK